MESTIKRLLISALAVTMTAGADQIVLKDGDRITGSIVKKDGATVTVKSKNFGVVTFPWADIATIQSDQPLNVVLSGDKTVKATIKTEDGKLQIGAAGTGQTVAPADVVALRDDAEQKTYERFVHPGILDLWTITGSLNIAGTKGNAETSTLTTPVNLVRASKSSRTALYFNSIRSSASINGTNSQTAMAVRGGWSYNRNLARKLFISTFNDYEYDKFQSLDLRVVLGGGLGYQAWKTKRGGLDIVAGGAWNREKFGPIAKPSFTRNSAEAYWGNDFNYKLNARTTFVQGFRMFNNLSNSGEYRINFDIGATTSLTKWLNWNISLSDRYLSNPAAGRKSNDFLYSTGFGFSFAR